MKSSFYKNIILKGLKYGAVTGVVIFILGILVTLSARDELIDVFYQTFGFPMLISLFKEKCLDVRCLPILLAKSVFFMQL